MAGITDLPFRRLVAGFGAGLVVSEMIASGELVKARPGCRDRALTDGQGREAVQIAGRDPALMAEAARMAEAMGAPIIDINMGCPAKKVTGGLSGSALMRDPDLALRLVDAVVAAVRVPVTLKTRLGWDADSLNAPVLARRARDAGVAMVTIHGRTRCQFYKGRADWAAIRPVVDALDVPVVANGDITGPDTARAALAQSGAAGVMIGRGAQGAPWVPAAMTHVLIHDAARPMVGRGVIDRVLAALADHPGAAPAVAVSDALWTGQDGRVTGLQDRAGLYRAQTPQGFARPAILAAHAAHPGGAADDVAVARAHGLDVAIVEGDEDNIKITLPGDFARAERILAQRGGQEPHMDVRLGNGYDVHRFGPGDAVVLCGVPVPHSHGLDGHSDADVGMHAVTDAIYGALAAGDIGRHFPPSDPQWKGADSALFLRHAAGLARDRGYAIGNVDCTLVCEMPKVGPYAAAMQTRLAEIMEMDADRIGVKATTSERLGFTGRGEGIAALATVALVRT